MADSDLTLLAAPRRDLGSTAMNGRRRAGPVIQCQMQTKATLAKIANVHNRTAARFFSSAATNFADSDIQPNKIWMAKSEAS